MSDSEIRSYLKKVEVAQRGGNATEHTYRSYLKELLETLYPGTTATNEPKRVACGAPDFIITKQHTPLGYIETKDIAVSLDHVERSDQMKRYLGSLGNLILTDYVEYRWYVAGQHSVPINKTQYFDGVPQHIWDFHVGGYQVCHKWLKDRKGRVLSFDDIKHYQRVVAALAETFTLMEQIDVAIEEHGDWPIS